MTGSVLQSLIAVVGTLSGGLLMSVVQARVARTTRRETRRDTRRRETLDAVTALAVAVADHRRAMWNVVDLRLAGAGDDVVLEARAESHRTRSAITAPLFQIGVLAPQLAAAAEDAVQATYALRGASDQEALEARRAESLAAERRLVEAAQRVFDHTELVARRRQAA